MPKSANPKPYIGIHAHPVFPKKEDGQTVPDLVRRFSGAARFAYNRIPEGQDGRELKRESRGQAH